MDEMIYDPEVECMPLTQLAELCQSRFRESRVMERAASSALYREKWAAAGVVPEEVRTYADLAQVPYTQGRDLRDTQMRHDPQEWVCSNSVRLWASTSGTTGKPKWIPIGEGDLAAFTEGAARLLGLVMGVREGFSFLFITAASPFSSEQAAYHFLVTQITADRHTEFTFVTLPETMDALTFARLAHTQAMFSFPSMALVVAEGVSEQAGPGARALFRKEPNLRNLLGALGASVMKIKAKHIFKFKWGIFSGEPVGPYRSAIIDHYGLEPCLAYGATEFSTPLVGECKAQDGMHIYLDFCLPEIITREELRKEESDAAYVPRAIPLWEASAGQIGELVLTSFSDALPLVRYRISDLAQVVSTEPCKCGRTHPRINVLHRSDDIVNLGLIRFSIYELKRKLEEEKAEHGQVAKWQLRLTRENYKPKAVLLVEPIGEVDERAFAQEVKDKLGDIGGIRQSWQSNLIAEPEIQVVQELREVRTATGKVQLAIYEDVYFEEA